MNDQPPPLRPWLAQELIWTLGSLLAGLLILPAIIYAVGLRMFGIYRGSNGSTGIGAFYSDFAHDLASAHLPSWTLALGPLVLVYVLRLILGMLPISNEWLRKLLRKEPVSEQR